MTLVLVAILVVGLLVTIGGWRHAHAANARMRLLTLREVLQVWEGFEQDSALYGWLLDEIAAANGGRVSKVERSRDHRR